MATLQEISDAMASVVDQGGQSVVSVGARRGTPTSGIVWTDGQVLTAAHGIHNEEGIQVGTGGGTHPATLLGHDSGSDLALLKVDGLKAPVAGRGDSSAVKVGSLVLALGRPGELQASLGTVASLSARVRGWRGGGLEQLIQTDATMHHGFSGGPLLDSSGKVIGINSWYYGRGNVRALPVEAADRVARSLQEHGRVKHAYLGMGTQPVFLAEALKAQLNQDSGLMVISVDADGPAAKAGVLQGDVVVAIATHQTARMRELFHALRQLEPGSTQALRLVRAGEVKEVQVQLGERSE
jgi:S1-C subfamily serine protease